MIDLVAVLVDRNRDGEIARAHPVGGGDQAHDRRRQPVGEAEPDADRGEQQEQRHDAEDHREGDLDARAAELQRAVLVDHLAGPVHVVEHPGVDEAADEQIGVDEVVEPHQRAHPVVGIAGQHHDVAVARLLEDRRRQALHLEHEAEAGAGDHLAVALEDDRLGQRAQRGLGVEQPLEHRRRAEQRRPLAIEVRGHRQRVGADHLLVLLEIGARDVERGGQRPADPLAEPGLEPEMEEADREDRDHDRRRHRDQAEQRHQAGMQARARRALPARHHQLHQAARDHHPEQQQQDHVEVEQAQDQIDVGAEAAASRTGPRRWRCRRGSRPRSAPPRSAPRPAGAAARRGSAATGAGTRRRGSASWRRTHHCEAHPSS